MMKLIFLLVLTLLSCSSGSKSIKSSKVLKTSDGYSFQIPMKGEWMDIGKTHLTRFHRLEKNALPRIFAEVNLSESEYGQDLSAFEEALANSANVVSSNYAIREFKKTNCLFHADKMVFKKEKKKIARSLMACMFPNMENKAILMTVSEVIPESETFEDLTDDEFAFFNSLKFY